MNQILSTASPKAAAPQSIAEVSTDIAAGLILLTRAGMMGAVKRPEADPVQDKRGL